MELRVKKITWSFTLEQNKTSIFKFKACIRMPYFMVFFFFCFRVELQRFHLLSWGLAEL